MTAHDAALELIAMGPATSAEVAAHCEVSGRQARRVLRELVGYGMVGADRRGSAWAYSLTGAGRLPEPKRPKTKPRTHAARRQDADRARLAADLEVFLAAGNKIETLPGYVQAPHHAAPARTRGVI